MINNWYKDQPRKESSSSFRSTFKETWTKEILEWIIESIRENVDALDIKFALVKKHGISLETARNWIKMCERLIVSIDGGMSLDDAMAVDLEYRLAQRRSKKIKKE